MTDTLNHVFETKLGNLFKARFPFLYLRTWEEDRAEGIIKAVAQNSIRVKTLRKVYTWDVCQGITGEGPNRTELKDPLKALDWMEKTDEPAIYVIKDIQEFLGQEDNGTGSDAVVLRRLRHLASLFQQSASPRTLIFLGGGKSLPASLERETHILDLHLPTAEDIRALLEEIRRANQGGSGIRFDLSPGDEECLIKAAQGLTLKEAENAFAYAMVEDGKLCVADVNVIMQEKCQVLRKSDLLEIIDSDLNVDAVGGLENLKGWLLKRKNAWLDAAARYGLPAPRGILLTGVPGCGKSLVAKTIGAAWQLPLLRLDPGRLYGSMMGSSEENVRKVISITEAIAPCVLWIDEIEKGFSTGSGQGDSGTSKRVFGTFLTWLQEKTQPVFVIATANNIDTLPPEFLRKGRFDEIFFVGLPNRTERMSILYLHLKKRLKAPEVIGDFRLNQEDTTRLSTMMEGFNGAEIEQVVISALFEAFSESRSLQISDLEKAISSTVPLSVTQSEQIEAMMEWARFRAVPASVPEPHENGLEISRALRGGD